MAQELGLKVLEVGTKNELAIGGSLQVQALAWSPDGKRLATFQAVGQPVKVWHADTGNYLFSLFPKNDRGVLKNVLSWSPEGRYIASSGNVWDVAARKVVLAIDPEIVGLRNEVVCWGKTGPVLPSVKEARPTPRTRLIVATSSNQSRYLAEFWGTKDTLGPPAPVAWARDARRLALSRADGFEIWDTATSQMTLSVGGLPGPLRALAWDPTAARIAAIGFEGSLFIRETARSQSLLKLSGTGKTRDVGNWSPLLAWSPDGTRLALTGEDRSARVLMVTAKELLDLYRLRGEVSAFAWSPDGKQLACGLVDATIQVWDLATGKEVADLHGEGGMLLSLAWSPDGRRLAAGSHNTLSLWDMTAGQVIATWPGAAGAVIWSPDGRWLASATTQPGDYNESTRMITVRDATRPSGELPTPAPR
jgi:WD40 repeat protein